MKIVILGNSLSERNGLKRTIAKIAESLANHEVTGTMVAPDGCTLQYHATDPKTYRIIKSRVPSILILQEQGEDTARGSEYTNEYIIPYAERIAEAFRMVNPEGRVILFQTWARKNGEADGFSVPEVGNYGGMQRRINQTCVEIADAIDAEIAPVGEAWQYVRENYPQIELYQPDGRHPSVAGTYLAACVFYEKIFSDHADDVRGASDLGIDPEQSQILREAADRFAWNQ